MAAISAEHLGASSVPSAGEILDAQLVAPASQGAIRRALSALASTVEWLFGAATLIVALAVLATVPLLQLMSLGYLLEASGRVARSGRIRDGVIGVRKAAIMGRIAMGAIALMTPLWIASSMRYSARLIDPTSRATRGWTIALGVLSVLVLAQIVSAVVRGGRIRHFLWPRPLRTIRLLAAPGAYARVRDRTCDFLISLRLPYYFWLGLRGFAGALVWLVVPVSLLAVASRLRPGGGVPAALVGGALFALVLVHLPFLQAAMAEQNRWGAMFELRAIRRRFARAPVAFLIALALALVLAVPLYLLKIEMIPREAAWLPSLLFVVSIFPARLAAGWALARSQRREVPRHWFFRVASRLAMLPLVLVYVVIVYFTQYLSWHGVWSLYEQHAFLVPVPFLGL